MGKHEENAKVIKAGFFEYQISSNKEPLTKLPICDEFLKCQNLEIQNINNEFLEEMKDNLISFDLGITTIIKLDEFFKLCDVNNLPISSVGVTFKGIAIESLFALDDRDKLHHFLMELKKVSKAKISGLRIVNGNDVIITLLYGIKECIKGEIYYYIVVLDTTKDYEQQKIIKYMAYHDTLTNLPNEKKLIESLDKLIGRKGRKKAVMLFNYRNFKTINMIYGYAYGNEVLKEAANKIKNLAGITCRAFRFNADRFILIVDEYHNRNELAKLAQRILSSLEEPSKINQESERLEGEVAILEVNNSILTLEDILKKLLVTMNYLDESAYESIRFYDEELTMQTMRYEKILKALKHVIKGDKEVAFYLEFQPKLDVKKNIIMGFEALARLYIEDLGQISPLEFIEIAEKEYIIHELGYQIFSRACDFIHKLLDEGFLETRVAVNISGRELLRNDFLGSIKENLKLNQIKPNSLEFEITESVLIMDFDSINEKLNEIKDIGILISIDDFGTGFSSLSRLQQFNVDFIKIDKIFVDKIGQCDEKELIIDDIISIAKKTGLEVVAEGVEEKSQLEYLGVNGCDIIQGYYLSKPLSAKKAVDFIKNYNN